MVERMMKRITTLAVWLLMWVCTAVQAELVATVNRASVGADEPVQLTLRTTEKGMQTPDLTAVEQDFEVLNTVQSSQIRIINGRRSDMRQWQYTLMPRRDGTLTIPELTLGSSSSKPISIHVNKPALAERGDSAPSDALAYITTDITPETVYVQQQMVLTVKIWYRVNLAQGAQLSDLEIPEAVVKQLGEIQNIQKLDNGVHYQGFEVRYAITPEKAGNLVIPPLIFNGSMVDMSDPFGHSLFSPRSTQPIGARSQELAVEVRPIPKDYPKDHPWLPAKNVAIAQKWSQSLANVKVGDALTRTITITGDGVAAAQLPPLTTSEPAGMNIYPEQPQMSDSQRAGQTVGKRVETVVMIPSQPGEFTLPAVSYSWLDIDSGKVRDATLPATKIRVTSAAAQPAVEPAPVTTTAPVQATTPSAPTMVETVTVEKTPWFWPALTALFVLLWLSTLWLLLRERWAVCRAHRQQVRNPDRLLMTDEAAAFARLEAAGKSGDAAKVIHEMMSWLVLFSGNPRLGSLEAAAQMLGAPEIARLTRELESLTYGQGAHSAQVHQVIEQLLAACRTLRHNKPQHSTGELPGLYPTS